MYKFEGLGTTHMVVTDDAGEQDSLKLRVHSFLLKLNQGRVCLNYKEFMRDEHWLPKDGQGWPVFKPEATINLANLKPMPTSPIANFSEVERRVQVSSRCSRLS